MAKKYPPLKYVFAACVQCLSVGFVYGICVLLTYFPMGPIVALTAKRGESPFGRPAAASIYGCFVIDRVLTPLEQQRVERFMAIKAGITL